MKHANIWPKESIHVAAKCSQIPQRFPFSVKQLGKNNLEWLQLITTQLWWMCPIMKTELVSENNFCLNPSFSVKDNLLVFPQILLNRRTPHPFPGIPVSSFPGFRLCCWVYVHIYICTHTGQNQNKLLQMFVFSPLCPCGPWKPSEPNWLRKSYI